jgi:hypothetical protein
MLGCFTARAGCPNQRDRMHRSGSSSFSTTRHQAPSRTTARRSWRGRRQSSAGRRRQRTVQSPSRRNAQARYSVARPAGAADIRAAVGRPDVAVNLAPASVPIDAESGRNHADGDAVGYRTETASATRRTSYLWRAVQSPKCSASENPRHELSGLVCRRAAVVSCLPGRKRVTPKLLRAAFGNLPNLRSSQSPRPVAARLLVVLPRRGSPAR